MSDEEKNYFFFKVHDLDGNDKLDGLEIFYSATHHSDSELESTASESHHHHDHEEQAETDPANENNNNEIDKLNGKSHEESEKDDTNEKSSDSVQNSSVTNLKLLEIEGSVDDGGDNKNLNHIIGMLPFCNTLKLLNQESQLLSKNQRVN